MKSSGPAYPGLNSPAPAGKNIIKRPLMLWLLVASLLFLSVGGLYGGIAMLADNTGRLLQLQEILKYLPVPDFTAPGIFLLVVMGLGPLFLVYGLLACPKWKLMEVISCWSGYQWGWTGTLVLGIVLAGWLTFQGVLIGFKWPIQFITAVNCLLIILLTLSPGVRKWNRLDSK